MQAQFKQQTGLDYKPGMAPPTSAPAPPTSSPDSGSCPFTRVTQQGELVRKLKAEKAPKVQPFMQFTICTVLIRLSNCWSHEIFRSCVPLVLMPNHFAQRLSSDDTWCHAAHTLKHLFTDVTCCMSSVEMLLVSHPAHDLPMCIPM